MFCAHTRTRYQVSVYRTIGPLVYFLTMRFIFFCSYQNSWKELATSANSEKHVGKYTCNMLVSTLVEPVSSAYHLFKQFGLISVLTKCWA